MPTAYLSIDSDFWMSPKKAFNALHGFYIALYKGKLKSLRGAWPWFNFPVVAVQNHQQMLRHANNHPADILINIDQHSGVAAENEIKELNCGTWISFVKWRKQADYLWVRSGPVWRGNCNGNNVDGYENRWNQGHGWRKATSILRSEKLDLCNLVKDYTLTGVGLCMSPDYIDREIEGVFRKIVKLFEIPYTKGRRNEDYARKIRPGKL